MLPQQPQSLRQKYLTASLKGDIDTILELIKKECTNFKRSILLDCFNNACEGGHQNIIKIINKYTQKYPTSAKRANLGTLPTFYYAFKSGNLDIISSIIFQTHSIYKEYDSLSWRYGLYGACESGRVDVFKMYKNHVCVTRFYIDECLTYACRSDNNLDLVKHLIKQGAANWNGGLKNACKYGQLKMIEFMIKKGADDWDSGVYAACDGGYINIVKLMYDLGALKSSRLSSRLFAACIEGHTDIIDLLIENGAKCWGEGLRGACIGGHVEIAKFMIKKGVICEKDGMDGMDGMDGVDGVDGVDEVNEAEYRKNIANINYCLQMACTNKHFEIVKLLLRTFNKIIDWYKGLSHACVGDVSIVKYMLDHHTYSVENLNDMLLNTDKYSVDIITLLFNNGANYFEHLCDTSDFKLYSWYLKYICFDHDNRYLQYLQNYPPCVLFVGSLLTSKYNKKCCIKKLPVELFKLLNEF